MGPPSQPTGWKDSCGRRTSDRGGWGTSTEELPRAWDGHSFESLLQRLPMCSTKCLSKTNSKHLTQGRAREVWKHFYSSQEQASNGRTSTACHSPPCACVQVPTLMIRERKAPDRGRRARSLKPSCTLNPNSTTPHKESSKSCNSQCKKITKYIR